MEPMTCNHCGGRMMYERHAYDVLELRCLQCSRAAVMSVFTAEDRSGIERKRAKRQERRIGVKR